MGSLMHIVLLLTLVTACGFPHPADIGNDAPADALEPGVIVHVSPAGDDVNDGVTQPVRTLQRAISIAGTNTQITTIALAMGRYAGSTGEHFPYLVPNNVKIVGAAGGSSILSGTKVEDGLTIDTGQLQDLEFEDFLVAVTATGVVDLKNIHIRASKLAMRGETNSKSKIDNLEIIGAVDTCGSGIELEGSADLAATTLTTRNLLTTLDAEDLSTIDIARADVTGDPRCRGLAFAIHTDRPFILSDSIIVGTYGGISIVGHPSSPAQVMLTNITLRNIQETVLSGIYVVVRMSGGEISNNTVGIADARSGTWALTNVKIQQNTGEGIYVSGAGGQSLGLLTMRDCIVTGNRDGVSLFDWSMADLGTSASPGGNILQNNQFAGVSISGSKGPMQVDAVGNTWNAGVQGADATGHYPVTATIVGPIAQAAGNNFDIWSGLSVRR